VVSVTQAPIFRWVVSPQPDPVAVVGLSERLHLPGALAALLVQRGQGDADVARRYLRPSLDDLSDPHTLAGMAEAVDAIALAVRAGGTILVHGDYDVDGQCATAVLTRALRAAGADVVPFVPHRLRDGYDFGPDGAPRRARRGRRPGKSAAEGSCSAGGAEGICAAI
jgi:single-stranded-DNA-specific exonuclease